MLDMPDATRLRTLGVLFTVCQSITHSTTLLPMLWFTLRKHPLPLRPMPAKTTCVECANIRYRLLPTDE
jgi:hypothetical protein